jgi:hypothetical protein
VGASLSRPGLGTWPGPATLFNGATATWYDAYQAIRAQLLLVLVCTELDQPDAARQAADRAAAAIAAQGLGAEAVAARLSQGIAGRAFLVPAETWRQFSPRPRQALRLACFQYAAGLEWAAEAQFQALLKDEAMKLSARDTAAIQFGLACCAARRGDPATAQRLLGAFDTDLRQSELAPAARLLYQLVPR